MPELPEVQTVVTSLQPIVGSRIDRVDLKRSDILTPPDADLAVLLTSRTIKSITRRGKRIVFSLDSKLSFYIHLGMSGQLTLEPVDNPLQKHTHLVIDIGGRQLRFRDPRRF